MNNPADLCTPTLGIFLEKHPGVVVVHGKGGDISWPFVWYTRRGSWCTMLLCVDHR